MALIFFATLAADHNACAFSYDPFYRNVYEIEFSFWVGNQRFSEINSTELSCFSYSSDCLQAGFCSAALVTPEVQMQSVVEVINTPQQDLTVSFVGVFFQKMLTQDLIGDPFTTTVGLSFYGRPANPDPSIFYQGNVGVELSFVVGKELCYTGCTSTRFWVAPFLGLSDNGDPWTRVRCQLERIWREDFCAKLWTVAGKGLGKQPFVDLLDFDGWGPIQYSYLDLGLKMDYSIQYCGYLFAQAEYRLFSENYPEKMWSLQLGFLYPFSL